MYYIGFDLGDGESCLSYWNDELPSMTPVTIPITHKSSFTTAVAIMKETGETVIGMNAITNAPTLTDLRVCFKRDFKSGDGDTNESFRRFISGVLRELRNADLPFDVDDHTQCRFVVGQPADWDPATLNRYKDLLALCGIHDPYMVSESRAALVYLNTAKFMQPYDPVGMSTLVCDFGSSTLDFAYCANGDSDRVTIFGDPRLGGGLMDEQIVLESIRRISDSEKQSFALEIFHTRRDIHSRLMMTARSLKEKYFLDPKGTDLSLSVPLFLPKLPSLTIYVDSSIIHAVILYPQPLLKNNSFYQQLHDQFQKVLEITKENPPEIVVLTGGASRMQFFRDICADVLQPYHPTIVFSDSPDKDIACGLALDGGHLSKLDQLKQELSRYADSEKTENIISDLLPALIQDLSETVVRMLTDDENNAYSVQQVFRSWKQLSEPQSLDDLKDMLEKNIKSFSNADDFTSALETVISKWMHRVFEEVQSDLDALCLQIGLNPVYVQLEQVHLSEPLEIGGALITPGEALIDTIDLVVTVITAIVVGNLTGGSGIALIYSGPIGIVIGILAVGALKFLFKDRAKEAMLQLKLAKPIRWTIPEVSVFNHFTIRKMTSDLEEELKVNSDINTQIQNSLARYIDAMVKTIACQTRV